MMKKITHYIIAGLIILFIIWLVIVLMHQPIWVLLLLIVLARYSDIKKFIKSL